ncbi:lipopolysaccharide biosynthesis protein [Sphingobacterium sp. BIGb0116]|uniref:lipopolysaccharide biosynthesis protein n=1 Tax=Sphingobacterium sp. BIGb0116 TaxID=2940619 RepID=UPI0021680D29|nr:lipopolysaccharide biosynthesis protein [Sphingobacterium sp. BIGb0116]MCS4166234.1 O-antigen/teichoic acid export membrane protein [Sphingobacterium sp. BIGb0116]
MKNRKLFFDSMWSMFTHIFSLFIVLFSNIILARLMSPQEFGEFGIVMFFVSVFNIFTDGGLSGALVRKLDKNENDYSTVFTYNLVVSIVLFILISCSSGYISDFYNNQQLKKPIIFAASILIISSFQTIQNVKFLQDLEFKKRSILNLISTLFGVLFGLTLAYVFKMELWALISIPLFTVICQTFLYNLYKGFYFNINFYKKSFKELFGFGVNTTLVSVLNLGFENIYQLVIGKVFSITQVGYFYQAKKMQDVPNNVVNNLAQGVFFSTLSKSQDNIGELIKTYNLISKTFIWLMGLAVLIILIFGKDIILFLLGENWLGSVFYIKLLIVGSMFYTQELINKMIFKVFNKTGKLLKLEIVKKIVQVLTLVLGVYLKRIDYLLYGYIFTNAFSYFLNYYYTSRIINIGNKELYFLGKICLILFSIFIIYYNVTIYLYNNDRSYIQLFGVILVSLYFVISKALGLFNLKSVFAVIKK